MKNEKKEVLENFYWYNNEKIKLFNSEKVAVRLSDNKALEKLNSTVEKLKDKDFTILRNNILLSDVKSKLLEKMGSSDLEGELEVFKTEDNNLLIVTNEIIIKFEDSTTEEEIEKILKKYNIQPVKSKNNLFVCGEGNALETANILHQNKQIKYAQPNFIRIFKPHFTPNDTLFANQWALENTGQGGGVVGADINAESAWDISPGSNNIIIAILDEGVDYNHEDLNVGTKLVMGYDALTGSNDPNPENDDAHGTACAGIASAGGDNVFGISGVAPDCSLMGVRIARGIVVNGDNVWETSDAEISNAIDTAVARGAHILSNSWGGGSPSNAITDSIQDARNNGRGGLGCVICFAAGNDNGSVSYPGSLSEVFTVAACNEFGERKSPTSQDGENWWGSNFGPEVDIAAPGVHITTTDISGGRGYSPDNYTSTFNGTSAATPHVAGVAGLILSVNPNLTVAQVEEILRETATDIDSVGYDNFTGFGRVNAFAAVQRAFGTVTPRTTSLNYIDVPENEERGLAIRFDVNSMSARNFEITTPLSLPLRIVNSTAGVGNTVAFDVVREVYLWITYKGTFNGDTIPPPPTSVTVRCIETNETWIVPITANTIARPTTAIMLCFDQSGSMDFASGIAGTKRIDILRYSANILMDVIQAGNSVGIVSFDQNAHDIAIPAIGPLGEPTSNVFDPLQILRQNLKNVISGFTPNLSGSTAIGDGLERAQLRLNETNGYEKKAVIVLTDGQETDSKYIADVADQIDSRVFAIGLGKAENINPAALNSLTNNTGGYLLMTDELNTDSMFKLGKYFLQILAGVTNENVVVDPTDRLIIGEKVKIPFVLNEADISSDVILMLPAREIIDLKIESPSGQIIDVSNYSAIPGVIYKPSQNVSFYRMSLPVAIGRGEQSGKWNAILEVNRDLLKKYYSDKRIYEEYKKMITHGVPYTLVVHSYSNLDMKAVLNQNSHEVGAKIMLNVSLTEYAIPLSKRASVKAYLKYPDGSTEILNLNYTGNGKYSVEVKTQMSGIYEFLIKAFGNTSRGTNFTREQVLTGSVWRGGDTPPPKTNPKDDNKNDLCELISCILGSMDKNYRERLIKEGFDVNQFEKCMKVKCSSKKGRRFNDADLTKIIGELNAMKNLI